MEEGLTKFGGVVHEDKNVISEFSNVESWETAHQKANVISFSNWPIDKKIVSNLKDDAKNKRTKIRESFMKSIENLKLYSSEEAMEDISFMEPILEGLKNLVLQFEENYKTAKKEKNIIDFHDIEHFALQILTNKNEKGEYVPSEVAKLYREKFLEIAIDEYQDSNLIQEYLLKTISNGNNIFMVGDVKQSIYKFRQAMPSLFLNKYEEYDLPEDLSKDSLGTKILLYKNFRSRKDIIDVTNEVFQSIMSKYLGDIEYSEEEYLNLGANYEEPENKEVEFAGKTELHIIDSKVEEDDEELLENSELEAKLVANRIHKLINNNYQVKDKYGYRNATYKDFVILLRAANTVAPIYEKELASQSIPVYSDTSSEYLQSTEIETILSLLKIIDNPNQDIALVTIMRSPMYHFDDNELISIRLNNKTGSYYQALKTAASEEKEPLKTKINNFLNQINLFRKKQEYMSLHEFIWYIYETTGYMSYITLTQNGALKMANLKMLFQRAKDYESVSFKGLYNFVHYIERMKKGNQDFGSAKIIGENENVVRIMSIHKSKGLEFPVVFICDTGKSFNFRDLNEKILLHQEIGFGPKYINYSRQIEYDTLAKEAIKEVSKQEAISEEMRVLYVALTRAKEKLIIVGSQNDTEKRLTEKKDLLENIKKEKLPSQIVKQYKTYIDWLELVYLKTKKELFDIHIYKQNEIEKTTNEQKNENNNLSFIIDPDFKQEIKHQVEWEYAKKNLSVIPSKSSVTSLKNANRINEETTENIECILDVPEFMKTEKNLTGAQRGTVMHFVLQRLDLKRMYSNKELQDFISSLVAKKLLTEQESQSVNVLKLEKFLNSSLAQDIRKAKRIYQEKPFYIYIPAKEIYGGDLEEKIVVQGIIDLYYRNSEGKLVLVDYKTDFVENGEESILVDKYKVQIETYKKALEHATGEKVEKCFIYSLYLSKEIEV